MFVRGLQGSFNQYAPKLGIKIPNGDVLLFGLCCGQIMFAFLLAPETIPREYNNWIQGVSFVPKFAVKGNLEAIRNNKVDTSIIQQALDYKHLTPHNRTELTTMMHNAQNDVAAGFFIPCAMLHPWVDSCYMCNFQRFFQVFVSTTMLWQALTPSAKCFQCTRHCISSRCWCSAVTRSSTTLSRCLPRPAGALPAVVPSSASLSSFTKVG